MHKGVRSSRGLWYAETGHTLARRNGFKDSPQVPLVSEISGQRLTVSDQWAEKRKLTTGN